MLLPRNILDNSIYPPKG